MCLSGVESGRSSIGSSAPPLKEHGTEATLPRTDPACQPDRGPYRNVCRPLRQPTRIARDALRCVCRDFERPEEPSVVFSRSSGGPMLGRYRVWWRRRFGVATTLDARVDLRLIQVSRRTEPPAGDLHPNAPPRLPSAHRRQGRRAGLRRAPSRGARRRRAAPCSRCATRVRRARSRA
jgi:hypothetical protein